MTYELRVTADSKEELLALLSGGFEKPKKVQVAEEVKSETPKEEETKEAPKEVKQEVKSEIQYSLEDVQRAFKEKATKTNKRHMVEILQAYGATKVSGLKPEQFNDVMQEIALVEV